MASPFSAFRKYQKVLLAAVAILAMIAFVFVPTWSGMTDSPRGNDQVVATWQHGTIYESDLARYRQQRAVINQFLEQVSMPQRLQYMQQLGQFIPPPQLPTDDKSIVRDIMLAKQAERQGVEYGDTGINAFLRQMSGDLVPPDQMRQIISEMQRAGSRMSTAQLFDAMRPILLANQYRGMVTSGYRGAPPAERWQNFQRLNREITAQVVPVQVEQFLDQVEEPGDSQLRELYEQYKDVAKTPAEVQGVELSTPEPGFKSPFQAKFQIARADKETFAQQLLAEDKFTEKELEDFYNSHKFQFLAPPTSDATDAEAPAGETTSEPAGESTDLPSAEMTDEPAGDDTADLPPSETLEDPADEGAEDSAPADAETPADGDVPADDSGADSLEEPLPETEDEVPAEGGTVRTSQDRFAGDEYLLAQADEAELPAAETEDAPVEDVPGSDAVVEVPTDEAPAGDSTLEPADLEDAPLESTPSDALMESTADLPAGEGTDAEMPAGESTLGPTTTPFQPQFQPLAEVIDQVKLAVARQKADERMRTAIDSLRNDVQNFSGEYALWQSDRVQTPDLEEPFRPDFAARAQELGLSFVPATEMLSAAEAAKASGFPSDSAFVMNQAFSENTPLYAPLETTDVQDNLYLLWKIEQRAEFVPSFEEIRAEVVRAWKMRGAYDLAVARAKQMAEQARSNAGGLNAEFPNRATEVGPFAWFTFGDVPAQMGESAGPRLSELPSLPEVGPEFMEQAMSLERGEIGIAPNHPHTVVYVIQVTQTPESMEALRREFTSSAATGGGRFAAIGQMELQQADEAWLTSLERELELEWARPARADARR